MLLTDKKNLWKAVKLLFTEKSCVGGNNNVLSEKNKFINDDKNVSETLNSYFDNIVTTLDIREKTNIIEKVPTDMEPRDKAIIKFRNHSSVLLIKEKVNNLYYTFSFEDMEINEIIK